MGVMLLKEKPFHFKQNQIIFLRKSQVPRKRGSGST